MKSVIEEGSSISKAIESGWVKAGKPKEFTVKIFQEAKKNFFGFTKIAAKVAIFFHEEVREKAYHKPRPNNNPNQNRNANPNRHSNNPNRNPNRRPEGSSAVSSDSANRNPANKQTRTADNNPNRNHNNNPNRNPNRPPQNFVKKPDLAKRGVHPAAPAIAKGDGRERVEGTDKDDKPNPR